MAGSDARTPGTEQAVPLDLDAIRARCEATTAGPWEAAEMLRWPGRWDVWEADGRKCIAEVLWERDAEFIAHARTDVEALLAEVERLRVVEVASIGAHALLEDAEAAIERVRALHVPWYEASGKRYENRVYVPQCDMEHVTDHVCTLGDAYHAEACIPGEEHQVLACCECRQATEDGDPGYPLWPCPTLRALDLVAGDDGPEVSRG